MEGDERALSSDLDAEEESPYLRRQKAVAVRRRRFSSRVRWILLWATVLFCLGAVGYFAVSFAIAWPLFVLSSPHDIVVDGNEYVSRQEVLSVLGLSASGPVPIPLTAFRPSLSERAKEVESISWVQSAIVMRGYPHRLAVHIVERVPVAFANVGGRLKVVDEEGVFLEKPEKADFDFPVLAGLDTVENAAERRLRLALYRNFMAGVAGVTSQSGWLISEVNLADAGDLKALMVLGSETILTHFGDADFLERFRRFLAVLPEVRKTNSKIDSVDLRYGGQIVVNPQKGSDK